MGMISIHAVQREPLRLHYPANARDMMPAWHDGVQQLCPKCFCASYCSGSRQMRLRILIDISLKINEVCFLEYC